MQPGDVPESYADIETARRDLGFEPKSDDRDRTCRFCRMVQAVSRLELTGTALSYSSCFWHRDRFENGTWICGHRARLCRVAGRPGVGETIRPGDWIDISSRRIDELRNARDATGEVAEAELRASSLILSNDPDALDQASFFIVTVPTPIDSARHPDLVASRERLCLDRSAAGRGSRRCVRIDRLSRADRAKSADRCWRSPRVCARAIDFKLGYSPERINPGDREHRLETITKVVAARRGDAASGSRRSMAPSSAPASIGRPRSRWPKPPR